MIEKIIFIFFIMFNATLAACPIAHDRRIDDKYYWVGSVK